MTPITLKAHFDGQQIVLDEPYELPQGSALIVTVVAPVDGAEGADWSRIAAAGLAGAYADDEPEYSLADVKS
jgi:hypothetical protein